MGRRRPVPRYRTTRFAFVGLAPPTKMSAAGKPAALSRLRDGLGDRRRRAGRVAGLDLDHLLVDRARELAFALRRHGAILRGGHAGEGDDAQSSQYPS